MRKYKLSLRVLKDRVLLVLFARGWSMCVNSQIISLCQKEKLCPTQDEFNALYKLCIGML